MLNRTTTHPLFTYGEYLQWQGDERWELIAGEAFLMSPAPSRRHQRAVIGLAAQVEHHLRDRSCEVYTAPFDVRLPAADEADERIETVVQPDVVIVCDRAKLDDFGCRGAPDWIVEILSPATAARDRVEKRDLYEQHGVQEYWILDTATAELTIYLQQQGFQGSYSPPRTRPAKEIPGPRLFPDLILDWQRILFL